MKRGLKGHHRIRALRRQRGERRDRAAELHEELRGERDLGVTVTGDDLLYRELAGNRELLGDRGCKPRVGTRGYVHGVGRTSHEPREVGLEERGARAEPRVGALRLGHDLEQRLRCARTTRGQQREIARDERRALGFVQCV